MRYLVMAFCICALAACGKNRVPEGVIREAKFVDVLVDVHLAEASALHYRAASDSLDIMLSDLYATVMKNHEITTQAFLLSLEYYQDRPEEMNAIYEKVIEKLSALEVEWANKYE
jgi:hypothetical protein